MAKIRVIWFLWPVMLLGSCMTGRFTYQQMERIRRGMFPEEVIAILGEPSYRSFSENSEMLEFRDAEYGTAKVIKVWFMDNRVVEMEGYLDRYEGGSARPSQTTGSSEKEKESGSTSSVRVTKDGKHVLQMGSLVVTPDGRHETVVSDGGGVIVTASGEHFVVFE